MAKRSRKRQFFDEILRRQRRIQRTDRRQVALRILATGGPNVQIKNHAHSLWPHRSERFRKAVDIFLASRIAQAARVNDRRAGGMTAASSGRPARSPVKLASKFSNLSRKEQRAFLTCADLVGTRTEVTVCSDPFLLFLSDFHQECGAASEAHERSRIGEGRGEFPSSDEDDRLGADDAERQKLLLYELFSDDHVLKAARRTWNALSDEAREPYRFRAITAALLPAAIDQAF